MPNEIATPLGGTLLGLDIEDLLNTLAGGGVNLVNNIGSGETVDEFTVRNDNDQLVVGGPAKADFQTSYGAVPTDITYHGSGTLSFADISLLGLVSIQINPIENVGLFTADADGQPYFLSETALNSANLTASATVLGVPILETDLTSLVGAVNGVLGILGSITLNDILNNLQFDYEITNDPYQLDHSTVVCFTRGALIRTKDGLVPVEDLKTGDLVLTRDNGFQAVQWIGSRKVSAITLVASPHIRPIRIRTNALGDGMPSADLLVSPQHRILVRSKIAQRMFDTDEVLVAAKHLCAIDGIDIAEDVGDVEYWHFLLDRHQVVYANGAATESLYTGPQALKSIGAAAREEILSLFPELTEINYEPVSARHFLTGKKGRQLAMRHQKNSKPLVMQIPYQLSVREYGTRNPTRVAPHCDQPRWGFFYCEVGRMFHCWWIPQNWCS